MTTSADRLADFSTCESSTALSIVSRGPVVEATFNQLAEAADDLHNISEPKPRKTR